MIARMQKLLMVGPQERKEQVLRALQKAGLVEIQPYQGKQYPIDGRTVSSAKADAALQAIKTTDRYADTPSDEATLGAVRAADLEALVTEVPQLENELKKCTEEISLLDQKLNAMEPWGMFCLRDIHYIQITGNLVIQFWFVPRKMESEINTSESLATITIRETPQRRYFITFARTLLKIEHAHEVIFETDPPELYEKRQQWENRRQSVLKRLAAIHSRREELYQYYLTHLNEVQFHKAARGIIHHLDNRLFVLQSWCPKDHLNDLRQSLDNEPITLIPVEPEKDDRIPTYITPKRVSEDLGSDLVKIYDTPSYNDWDPSTWVFLAFTVFFAMILADGGYGMILLGLMIYLKFKVKNPSPGIRRFIHLSMVLSGATVVYGLLSGGFFGISLDETAFAVLAPLTDFLKRLRLLNTNDMAFMMMIAIWIGMVHICLSLILRGLRSLMDEKNPVGLLIHLTWIVAIWAFYFWYRYKDDDILRDYYSVNGLLALQIAGGMLVVLYAISARTLNPMKMFMTSFFGLYNGVQFFSDILSYIRIFALGLSGALLAQTFNNLSYGLWTSGAVGMILAPLIWLLGHTLNLILCIMGGVIHGLRLNFLEWYRWSFEGGGKRFTPFRDLLASYVRKETSS